MYSYKDENICITINENNIWNFSSIQVKAEKTTLKHVKTCELCFAIRL